MRNTQLTGSAGTGTVYTAFWQLRKSPKFNQECYDSYDFAIGLH